MTITAVWPISSPADPNGGDGLTVRDEAGVAELVARLSEGDAGAATIWHEGRELANEATGMPDHDVVAAVANGFGYLSHIDAEHDYAVLVGDPDSPAYSSEGVEFPAGSGVPPAELAEALREFLVTGQRATSVRWQVIEI